MILADVGNRHVHIWEDGQVLHLSLMDAMEQYGTEEVYYINVSSAYSDTLAALEEWEDISEALTIKGEYDGMGIDRKALCLSHDNGIFVDAGSAITVDKVVNGVYQGGFILPGIHAYAKAYADISPILDVELDRSTDLDSLPKSTQSSVSFGTIAPLIAVIEKIRSGFPLYFTGGDGTWLSTYFSDAQVDETLLFEGMKKSITRKQR
jgi:type III pantothenate kinase